MALIIVSLVMADGAPRDQASHHLSYLISSYFLRALSSPAKSINRTPTREPLHLLFPLLSTLFPYISSQCTPYQRGLLRPPCIAKPQPPPFPIPFCSFTFFHGTYRRHDIHGASLSLSTSIHNSGEQKVGLSWSLLFSLCFEENLLGTQ